ncbi:MAG: hypothetical protein J5847_00530, partial [Clostridia bacterium]|nr:hypothetical protein [Clostridia bacterium]
MSTIAFRNQGKTTGDIQNNYPTVFEHGFVGWGEQDGVYKLFPYLGAFHGSLTKEMNSRGYETYQPSTSGWQSAWDRCCELWAILNGGTVDYGKVHSEKYGHARYGRTYEKGLIPDWGQPGDHAKINFVGHSFGGPTALVFESLLAEGSKEERDGTPADELSDLFKGGKGDWLHTVTTFSGVNNGSNFASFLHTIGVIVIDDLVLCAVTMLGNSKFNDYYDANMDQWGVMDDPKTRKTGLRSPFAAWKEIRRYDKNPNLDSIGHEMQVECMYLMNSLLSMDKDAYHFARRALGSEPKGDGERHRMRKDATMIAKIAGFLTCNWRGLHLETIPQFDYDHKRDMYNDGFVTVIGQSAPVDK